MKHRSEPNHPDWMPMSVYENPALLKPNERLLWASALLTISTNAMVGFALSRFPNTPWAQGLVTFVLGLSDSFATRFHDLQGLTQTGGYFYVGALVVSSISAIILSVLFIAFYMRITFLTGHAVPFKSKNVLGVVATAFFAAVIVNLFFFEKMETGPYMGMSRIFLPEIFPALAYGVAITVPLAVTQIFVLVLKFFFLRGKTNDG